MSLVTNRFLRIDPQISEATARRGMFKGFLRIPKKLQMVPPVGLEPTLLAEPDFESGASTNSTTGACRKQV